MGETNAPGDLFQTVVTTLNEGVIVVDRCGRVLFANSAAKDSMCGQLASAISLVADGGERSLALYDTNGEPLPPHHRPLARTLRTGASTKDVIGVDHVGHRRWLAVAGTPLQPGHPESPVVMTLTDITEYRAITQELTRQATHDHLTGLPNRAHTITTLEYYLRARHRRDPLVVMFIDLDDLKKVNDTYGHSVGDTVLATSARRLRDALPATATLGRIGGDEFVAIHLDGTDTLPRLTEHLHAALHAPTIAGHDIRPQASIGVVIVPPGDTRTTDHILRSADHAMYRAKTRGGHRTHYHREHQLRPHHGQAPHHERPT